VTDRSTCFLFHPVVLHVGDPLYFSPFPPSFILSFSPAPFLADRIVRAQDINRSLYEREEEDSERGL